MDILYTVDEKYLQAVEELYYEELPKAIHFFNEIINTDPDYARAYYQLGFCYYCQFKNYQTAGYYFNKCIEFDASFPEVYEHHLKLLITLKMHKSVHQIAEKELGAPGRMQSKYLRKPGLICRRESKPRSGQGEQYRLAACTIFQSPDEGSRLTSKHRS